MLVKHALVLDENAMIVPYSPERDIRVFEHCS
ncbi:DNA polymerase Y family protein [Corynebacterium rouxii]|uniref:DNA polymerase Y family protein n=1 Tax=Corynebacterium rouxii TaxID=2719119 RepID=A0A6I8MEG3_9CORY|nr:DNA polymerase Y family protein [Corynebacterium rouxii]